VIDQLRTLARDLARDRGHELCANARFDRAGYRRELLERDGASELWLLTWLPTQITPIHDHDGPGACVVVSGELFEETFAIAGEHAIRTSARRRSVGACDLVDATTVHRVRALTTTISLHLVIPTAREVRTFAEAA
jgi:predicted metal-dependent enzyme (double-stranded beta helix superfamily)